MAFDTALWLLDCAAKMRAPIQPGAKILDYGCGAGSLVYRFRELGFDAYGFDIHNYVELKCPSDIRYFGFADADVSAFDMNIDSGRLRIPFPDGMFDLVVSTSVLEHVLDCAAVFRETARILKSDGGALHVYPDRLSFIEPHMYVPLATMVQARWWFYLWACLGVRNEFQTSLSAAETTDANLRYSKVGISYPPRRFILARCREHFRDASIVNHKCYAVGGASLHVRLYNYLFSRPLQLVKNFYRERHLLKVIALGQRLNILLCSKPNGRQSSVVPR